MLFAKKSNVYKLVAIIFGFTLAIITNNLVHAENLDSAKFTIQELDKTSSFTIAQTFKQLDFSNTYYQKLSEADYYYRQGNLSQAKEIQQQVKPAFAATATVPPAIDDLAKLDAKGQQYWNTANKAIEANPETELEITGKIFEPLQSLVKEYPGFIPGHILLADTYDLYGEEKPALATIEKAAEMYPAREDILDTKIDLLLLYGQPLEASIAAREFAYSYPNNQKSKAYEQAANQYFEQYKKKLNSKITTSGILGSIGQVATGNELGALEIGQMLLAGEKSAGQSFAQSIKAQSKMVSDQKQLKYLNDIGQKLAKLMGRNEFEYEFNIVDDPTPNAFALPGGKIFFHTGMLELMDSEAELAGVLAHEIAHSVLSHSYKQIGESALTGTASNLITSMIGRGAGAASQVGGLLLNQKFSRDKEKQSDILGLRVLDAAGYSADGLYNVMAKLKKLQGESGTGASLLSSHPASEERMRYLEELIQTKGYNRYGYEGVEAYRSVFPR
ncbi:MAG TPA: M48 family metalloprotease [Coleofasciculaceae cyanobacterium]|jgi:Zn-dependent protease with chaperone function